MLGQPAVLLSVCPLGFLSLNASRDPAHRSWQWALSEGRHRSNNQLFVSRGVGRHTEPLELTTVTAAAARPSELNTRFVSIAALHVRTSNTWRVQSDRRAMRFSAGSFGDRLTGLRHDWIFPLKNFKETLRWFYMWKPHRLSSSLEVCVEK